MPGENSILREHGNYEVKDYASTARAIDGLPYLRIIECGGDTRIINCSILPRPDVTNLANGGQPFNFTMLTVDTHFEDGYLCRSVPG